MQSLPKGEQTIERASGKSCLRQRSAKHSSYIIHSVSRVVGPQAIPLNSECHGRPAHSQVRAVRPLGNAMRASHQLRAAPETLAALTPSTGPPPTGRREFGLPDALRKRGDAAGTPLEVWCLLP